MSAIVLATLNAFEEEGVGVWLSLLIVCDFSVGRNGCLRIGDYLLGNGNEIAACGKFLECHKIQIHKSL